MNPELKDTTIDQSLKNLLQQIRKTQWLRAAFIIVTVALLGLLVIMAADWQFSPLATPVRWLMFGGWIIAIMIAAQKGLAPLFHKISKVQLARWVEIRHPEIQERISTTLELQGTESGISVGLLAELRKAAVIDAASVDMRHEIKTVSTLALWRRPAIILLLILGMLLAVWPRQSARLLVRAVSPFSTLGNAGAASFTIAPGSIELLEGESLKIDISYSGPETSLELLTDWGNGQTAIENLARSNGKFQYELNPVTKSFRYRLRAGKDESDAFAVTVWPLPILTATELTVKAPAYLGLAPEIGTLGNQVSAVSGSSFQLTCKTNTTIESARIEVLGKTLIEGRISSISGASKIDFEWTMNSPGTSDATVMLKHRLGREIAAQSFRIEIREDTSPKVVLLNPSQRELRLRSDEMINLRYDVIEDFSLHQVDVELNDYSNQNLAIPMDLPFSLQGTKPPKYRGSLSLSIGSLIAQLGGNRNFQIRVKAQDGKPAEFSGPGIGYSEWIKIQIDDHAESLTRQELKQQHEGAFEKIDKTIHEIRQARERMDWHREEIKRAEQSEDAVKNLTEASEKLAQAQQDTRKLAEEMQESIHAPLADELNQAAEKIQQSRENMENAPLQDEMAQREEKINEAREGAEQAIQQLEQLKQKMNQETERIQDLARLQDLAQQQQELARQAKELTQTPPRADDKNPQQAWQQQQDQLKNQIRQELQEQPQALAEALKQQAEEVTQLAKEAKQTAQSQQQLQEQAKAAVDSQPLADELRKALASEQAQIAQETTAQLDQSREQRSKLADSLPDAVAATDRANEQISSATPAAASEATAKAQASLEQASNQAQALAQSPPPQASTATEANISQNQRAAKNLQQLAERQKNVSDAMQALATGETQKALQALQQSQATQAKTLSQAIAAVPQALDSGNLQQAEQRGNEGAQKAQQASQQAQQGQQQQASSEHQQSQQNFESSAQALEQAAAEFTQAAQNAAQQQASPQQAPSSPQALAEAFQQASRASENQQLPQAAQQAAQAAQALQQAVQSARSAMQGRPQFARPQNQPSSPATPNSQAGKQAIQSPETPRAPEADPAVPPELAKLGISLADWEKIQATLNSDVAAGGANQVPVEYRELVKGYFQSISNK